MMGGTVFAFLGGMHFWWFKITERCITNSGRISCIIIFIGFNATFFVQFVMGSQGMPRRYFNYEPEFYIYHLISSLGSYFMAIGFLISAAVFLHSLFRGKPAPANPWGSNSLEWHTSSPPPTENFEKTPIAGDPYDYSDLVYNKEIGGYVTKQAAVRST